MIYDYKVLWQTLGGTPPAWYRCALPANKMEQTWNGLTYEGTLIAGNVNEVSDPTRFDVVVMQQPKGIAQLNKILGLQKQGVKVLYEVDDYLHGVSKVKGHRFADFYSKKDLVEFENCMRVSDGIICSTDYLAKKYKKFNPNTYVCKVALDTWRYDQELPENKILRIGWAGGTGHEAAMINPLASIYSIMEEYSEIAFVCIGSNYADFIGDTWPTRYLRLPWVSIENYPSILTNIDIAIAPAHPSNYHKSKSDLRWLEASAIGIPVVANPLIYNQVIDGVTGLLADTGEKLEENLSKLIEDKDLRQTIGSQAKSWVQSNRDIEQGVDSWDEIFTDILSK